VAVSEERRSPVDRYLERRIEDVRVDNPEISRSSLQRERSLEGYFNAHGPPRWMERIAEIERGIARERRRLQAAYAHVPRERWRAFAEAWPFEHVNELIRQHNEWFPIERRLPMNPRTGEYVLIHGRSYRREELDADWILEQFPADP
jgi:hypothetical protein